MLCLSQAGCGNEALSQASCPRVSFSPGSATRNQPRDIFTGLGGVSHILKCNFIEI